MNYDVHGGNHALGLIYLPAWDKKVVSGAKILNSTPPFVVLRDKQCHLRQFRLGISSITRITTVSSNA